MDHETVEVKFYMEIKPGTDAESIVKTLVETAESSEGVLAAWSGDVATWEA